MSQVQEGQHSSDITYLIVDDEIAANRVSQEDFIDDLGFSNTNPQFVANCEDALNALKQNLEIKFCFLDCKLPRTKSESVNYNPSDSSDYGIELIDNINQINQEIPIIVFSAYVDRTILQEQTQKNSNIVGYLRKDESPESYREAFKLALQYCGIPVPKLEVQNSTLPIRNISFDYGDLSQEESEIIKLKTQTIKDLVKKTAESILQIGKNLADVKAALPRGRFYAWAESEFPWSITMVNRFMRVYEKFNSLPTEELELLPVTVLYELASKSVKDEAIAETIDIAKTGEVITVAKVKEIKNKHSESKKKTKRDLQTADSQSPIIDTQQTLEDSQDELNLIGDEQLIDDSTGFSDDRSIEKVTPKNLDSNKPKQQIIQVLTQKRLWNVDKHIIYNGDPNSQRFLDLLPPKALICLNFAPDLDFKFQYTEYDSWINLHIKNPNLDSQKLVDLIDEVIGSSTDDLDAVIVLYIPHVDIVNIVHDWYCKAYVVDPDYQKCLAVANRQLDSPDII